MARREDLDRIERDIADARRDAGATIAALEQRLSPGRLMDEALDLLHDRRTLRRVGDSLAGNVGPLLLIAAGLGWWAYNLSRQTTSDVWDERRYGPRTSPYAPTPASLDPLVSPDDAPRSHHVHVSPGRPDAPPGHPPSPDDLLGAAPANKSAADSARAFRRAEAVSGDGAGG